jgi:hypothetical protein
VTTSTSIDDVPLMRMDVPVIEILNESFPTAPGFEKYRNAGPCTNRRPDFGSSIMAMFSIMIVDQRSP